MRPFVNYNIFQKPVFRGCEVLWNGPYTLCQAGWYLHLSPTFLFSLWRLDLSNTICSRIKKRTTFCFLFQNVCFCIYIIFATVFCIVCFDQFAKYEVCKMVDRNIAPRSKIREESFTDGDESRHRLGEVVIRKWLEEKEEVGTPSQLFFSQTQNYCQLLFIFIDRQNLQNKIYVLILHL